MPIRYAGFWIRNIKVDYIFKVFCGFRRTSVIDPRTGASTTHYNTFGQVDYVEDADKNRTSFSYDPATGLYNKVITRTFETTGVPGRSTGFNTGVDYSVTYGYEPDTGRFKSVSWAVSGVKGSFILPLLESMSDIQLKKPVKVHKSDAIREAKDAVVLVVCYE